MGSKYTLRLNDFDSETLKALAERTGRSKSDLIREGLRNVFAARLDQPNIWASKEDYDACLKKMCEPETDPEVFAGRERLKAVKPVWED
jgi:Arc/MetJ-type ribon-helix-helix transcriptional regulator